MSDKDKILNLLQKNGITDIDTLAEQLANEDESPLGSIVKQDGIDQASWFIKAVRLDKRLADLERTDFNSLPNEVGGDGF